MTECQSLCGYLFLYIMNNSPDKSKKCLNTLSTRVNVLNVNIPYIPLLLKDISTYTQSNNYESNYVKTIQTIGHIQRKGNIVQIVDVHATEISLPVYINLLPINEIYFEVPRNNINNIWEYDAVRVYGTLVKRESQIILDITHIFEVKEINLCKNLFDTLSLLNRKEYHQYSLNKEVGKLLDMQWEKIKLVC